MKIVRFIGVTIGGAIVAWLIRSVGWAQIQDSLGMLGWGYGAVLAYPLSWILLNTTGWRWALHPQYANFPLWRLAHTRFSRTTCW